MTKKNKRVPETTTPTPSASAASKKTSQKRPALEVAPPIVATTIPDGNPTGATHPSIPSMPPVILPASSSESGATAPSSSQPSSTVDVAGGPPDATFPTVPAGFVPTKGRARGFSGLNGDEIQAMPLILTDLGNVTALGLVLGSSAPDLSVMTAEITAGLKWRAMRLLTQTWAQYMLEGDLTAWRQVATSLEQIRLLFQGALACNPSLAKTFPGLTAYYMAQKAPAKVAVATRKRNAKAKGVAQSQAAQAAVQTAAPSASVAATPKVTIST